jgi:hypothetical protein
LHLFGGILQQFHAEAKGSKSSSEGIADAINRGYTWGDEMESHCAASIAYGRKVLYDTKLSW